MKNTKVVSSDVSALAEDARALMNATAEVAGDKVSEARQRLHAALERCKEIYGDVRERTIEGAKAADQTVRENPYQSIAIGVGVGALLGFLVTRSCCSRNDK